MIVQLDLKSLSPSTIYRCAKVGSDIVVATQLGSSVDMHGYSWNGSTLTYVTNAGMSGLGNGPGGRMIYAGGYIYIPTATSSIGGAAFVTQYSYDGMNFTMGNQAFLGGIYTSAGGSRIGDVATDNTYLYCPADTYIPFTSTRVWRMHAINMSTLLVVGTPLDISATDFSGRVVAQGGSIFYTYYTGIRRLTFNGATFTVATTLPNATMSVLNMVGDGTYIYIGHTDGHSILVYNNSLSLVTTYDTTFTGNQLSYAGGNLYVGSATGTRIYTFDGANFTYQDSMPTQSISEIIV